MWGKKFSAPKIVSKGMIYFRPKFIETLSGSIEQEFSTFIDPEGFGVSSAQCSGQTEATSIYSGESKGLLLKERES